MTLSNLHRHHPDPTSAAGDLARIPPDARQLAANASMLGPVLGSGYFLTRWDIKGNEAEVAFKHVDPAPGGTEIVLSLSLISLSDHLRG